MITEATPKTEITLNEPPRYVAMSAEQRAAFERDGFLIVRNALPVEMIDRLTAAVDRLCAEGITREGLSERNHWQMRNCIGADPIFLELLDWPGILPLVVGILNANIQLVTSHIIVRPPNPPGTPDTFKGEGWHRDGGTSSGEMQEPHPRILLKVNYLLSDQSEPGRGNTQFVPGSHRLMGRPAQDPAAPHPYGAIEVCGKPGDAVIFEQRMWHAVGPNRSDITRKGVFFGYGYRWLRPMDYVTQPAELLQRCTPLQRQLLGDAATELGYYIPTDADLPLRALAQEWEGARK